jgi:hypothetical protein
VGESGGAIRVLVFGERICDRVESSCRIVGSVLYSESHLTWVIDLVTYQ